MANRRNRKRKKKAGKLGPGSGQSIEASLDETCNPARNAYLDTLRGAAIVLMVIDHVAANVFFIPVQDSSIRLVTRLSMPLFCVLMGFF